MEAKFDTCPVCGHNMHSANDQFCVNCNWELLVIPKEASSHLRDYLARKMSLAKKAYTDALELRSNLDESVQKLKLTDEELTASKAQIKDRDETLGKLKLQVSAIKADKEIWLGEKEKITKENQRLKQELYETAADFREAKILAESLGGKWKS